MRDHMRAEYALRAAAWAAVGLGLVMGCRAGPRPAPAGPQSTITATMPGSAAEAPTGNQPPDRETPTAQLVTPTSTAATLLPADRDAVVVQIGQVNHSPWEPELRAQMAPVFSMLASGFVVFAAEGGPSVDGWYQTLLPAEAMEGFLSRLVDQADVLGLARRQQAQPLVFRSRPDGRPVGESRWLAVYVNTRAGEGRLVISSSELEQPPAAQGPALAELSRILAALETWRGSVAESPDALATEAAKAALGWWVSQVQAYTPDAVVVGGTSAPPYLPVTVEARAWPLERPLADLVGVPFGDPPAEVLLSGAEAAIVWRRSREHASGFWGPLWRDEEGTERFLVGVRVAPPQGNYLLLDYEYEVPPEALAEPTTGSAAASLLQPEAPSPSSAVSQPDTPSPARSTGRP